MFSCCMWLVAIQLASTDMECFYHCRKFYWLARIGINQSSKLTWKPRQTRLDTYKVHLMDSGQIFPSPWMTQTSALQSVILGQLYHPGTGEKRKSSGATSDQLNQRLWRWASNPASSGFQLSRGFRWSVTMHV